MSEPVVGGTTGDVHDRARGTERRRGVLTNVFPPHALKRAVAETVNAVCREWTDDHIPERAAFLNIEHRRLAFALTAAR